MAGGPRIRASEDATIAGRFAAARAAAIVGGSQSCARNLRGLYQRLDASEQDFACFITALLHEGLAQTAEALVRDSIIALQRAGQTGAQEAVLRNATLWFADNPWFAAEYTLLASQEGNFEEAAYRWEAVRSRWPDRAPGNLVVSAANDKAFANVVADLDVDAAAFRREMARELPSDRNYIILFTPRSGSTWLISVLAATQVLGQPQSHKPRRCARRREGDEQQGSLRPARHSQAPTEIPERRFRNQGHRGRSDALRRGRVLRRVRYGYRDIQPLAGQHHCPGNIPVSRRIHGLVPLLGSCRYWHNPHQFTMPWKSSGGFSMSPTTRTRTC